MRFQTESSAPLTPTTREIRDARPTRQPVPLIHVRASVPAGVSSPCSCCRLKAMCIQGLSDGDMQEMNQLLMGRRKVHKGDSLFLQGEPLISLHAVRLGCFKSSMMLSDGTEHVTGFAFTGDLLGFDALGTDVHSTTATALEDSEACVLSYDAFLTMPSNARWGLRRRMHRMFGAELTREHWLMTLVAHTNSEPRVAAFLLLLSQRMRERGFSSTEFNLRMSRAEIGSYLGLTLESISRALSAFADRGLIEVRGRQLRLLDPEGIARVSESALPGSSLGFAHWESPTRSGPDVHPPLQA